MLVYTVRIRESSGNNNKVFTIYKVREQNLVLCTCQISNTLSEVLKFYLVLNIFPGI